MLRAAILLVALRATPRLHPELNFNLLAATPVQMSFLCLLWSVRMHCHMVGGCVSNERTLS